MITQVVADHIHSLPRPDVKPGIRPASERDVQAIADVVTANARHGQLLPRSAENIRASLPNWLVAEVDGQVVGIGSLLDMSPTPVEVRSLAVLPAYRSYGIGGRLVRRVVGRGPGRG